ncbi:gamma-glutamyltransferase [Tunturiibacter gelidoferens]|uniref:Gamma-glutamyltranspeptidase/glutathione hydrolase n=1 Tax=Tunturiibacter gelidiferens TaxID=3069689 RepID=A0ACC5P0T8_9BACT|nr:gamma-glutamyltransferase [Edaphobacter lichenicola]MBB5340455.1 gamma-glutamyltranspeptidase/glutathione hydrolase [Edaphobacter lichenicola]
MPAGTRVFAATVGLALLANQLAAQTGGPASEEPVRAKHAMVVTIHHDATDAGVAILKQGGNAIDAAVAVAFTLAVVYPQAGNLGGGGFMLIRTKHGQTHFLDYREKAPAAATRDMYLDEQKNVIPGLSTVGYKASGVPGTVAGLVYAQSHFGKLTLQQDMAPAIHFATDGYVLSAEEAQNLHSRMLSGFPTSAHIFQRDGDFYKEGDTFKQPLLAATLTRIAANPEDFYRGEMAKQIASFEQSGGGLITADDLAAYQVKDREPIKGTYHGYKIITAPPPSSGGIVLMEILNILSTYNLPKLGPDRSAPQVHIITEAFRRAYMDRADYLGDPDFTPQPLKEMANPAYAAAWRSSIQPASPTPSKDLIRPAGFMPPPPQLQPAAHESTQTTHFSIVDADGNAVSNTYTLNGTFGSGVTVEGLGFLMNNEMDDFASKMGVPNMYGLIQGPANSIAPGKRPLSAMTPTIVTTKGGVFRHARVAYVLGTPGGSTIITTVANNLLSCVDNGLNIQQAADAPRFHHQYLPDRLDLEKKFSPDVAEQLKAMGYNVNRLAVADEHNPGTWGDSELIAVDPKTHELLGGHDNRRDYGKAAGY